MLSKHVQCTHVKQFLQEAEAINSLTSDDDPKPKHMNLQVLNVRHYPHAQVKIKINYSLYAHAHIKLAQEDFV